MGGGRGGVLHGEHGPWPSNPLPCRALVYVQVEGTAGDVLVGPLHDNDVSAGDCRSVSDSVHGRVVDVTD